MKPNFLGRLAGVVLGLGLGVLGAKAQDAPGGFQRSPSGFEYQLFRKDATGRYQPRPLAVPADAPYAQRAGQVLTLFLEYRTGRDSVLMNSRRMQPGPVPFPLLATPPRGGVEEAVSLLLPGDSAVFRFLADSLFAKATPRQPVPPFIRRAGNTLSVFVAARQLLTETQFRTQQQAQQAEMKRKEQAQAKQIQARDEAYIVQYLKGKKLTYKRTPGGTYYVVLRRGPGLMLPQPGQTVSVRYRGALLKTGQEFDASSRHGNTPFSFALGQGQVIPGWDQGIAALPKGTKAVLYIPSPLGYGARGAGADIPANAILKFEVELVDVK